MATAPTRKLIRGLLWLLAAIVLAVALYVLAAWIGSSIPRNAEWREPKDGGVLIGVETNGVHTALVLPISTPEKDWRADFPLADLRRPDRPYTHVSISWGEREVFLDTPTWRNLSPRTVFNVLTRGGDALSHISYYVRPVASDDLRPLRLSANEYARLVSTIETSLRTARPPRHYPGYGQSDVFYDAPGLYTVIKTCNQWTSDRLADAGIRTGWWTPIAGGVMKWLPPTIDEGVFSRSPQPARVAVQSR